MICRNPEPVMLTEITKRCPNVDEIIIGDIATDDLVQEILHDCPKLQHFVITSERITRNTVEAVTEKCSNLKSFTLGRNNVIQSSVILQLMSTHAPYLEDLQIEWCKHVYFDDLPTNKPFQSLKTLSLIGTRLHQEVLITLAMSCPVLEYLCLSWCKLNSVIIGPNQRQHQAEDFDVVPRADFRKLKRLILTDCDDLSRVEVYANEVLEEIDLSQSRLLVNVYLQCKMLSMVSVSQCYSLETVDVTSDQLTKMVLSSLPELRDIKLDCDNLMELDISTSNSITFQSLMDLKCLDNIRTLNMNYSCQYNMQDINQRLLPKMKSLQKFQYGGHTLSHVSVNCDNIKRLDISDVTKANNFELNCKSVEELNIVNCHSIMEEELVKALTTGKGIEKKTGYTDEALTSTSEKEREGGVPNVQYLYLARLRHLHGNCLNMLKTQLVMVKTLQLHDCEYLRSVNLHDWPNLQIVTLTDCRRLTTLSVTVCPQITTLDIRWCGSISSFHVISDNLSILNTTGCVFKDFSLQSSRLNNLEVNGLCGTMDGSVNCQCPNLKSVSLTKCEYLTGPCLQKNFISQHHQRLQYLQLDACYAVSEIFIPASVSEVKLTAMRRLCDVELDDNCQLSVLHLNNLPKLPKPVRSRLLSQCCESVTDLQIRGVSREESLSISLPNLVSFTLYNCRSLVSVEVNCPYLRYLRIQGCPSLSNMRLLVEELITLQAAHSSQLMSLKALYLECGDVKFLSRMLAFYCPNLEELILSGHSISMNQILSIGHTLSFLRVMRLQGCSLDTTVSESLPGPLQLTGEYLERQDRSGKSKKALTVYFQ
ncbi:uncharacterized protein LOC144445722 [Glandiceps talaboti]